MASIDDIKEASASPRSASTNAGSVQAHSLTERIEAEKFIAATKAVAAGGRRGLRFNQFIPPAGDGVQPPK